MQQRGMRQVSYDTEVGRVTAVCRVLDMRRPNWLLGSMMASGCDVYFTKDRCWIAKNNGKEFDMIRSGGVLFVAARPSKPLSRKRSALELNSMSPAEVNQVTLTRVHAGFGVPCPARDTVDGEEPSVRIRIPTGPVTPSAVERTLPKASGHALYRRWCRWCAAARAADEPHLREQKPETDEAGLRIEFDSAELEREEDRTLSTSSLNAFDDGSESLTATLFSTKAFSGYLAESTLAFVEVLGHNVVMLHSDQELVLVQLLKTVQRRRFERTSVRHGPKTSHQSQSKNENVNQVINGVCWSMWLPLENLLREKLSKDSILLAWLIRHAAWSLTKFQVKNDRRTTLLRVSEKAYMSQLPFGERVMYEQTAVPTGNLNQIWSHGIWVGEAPMTDECIILTENVVQKAKSLHRVTP